MGKPRTCPARASPKVERGSTVGAGDAMVAGLAAALARGDDIEHGLVLVRPQGLLRRAHLRHTTKTVN
jgi:fructose-1-phosphate kinase PfkB-like protein